MSKKILVIVICVLVFSFLSFASYGLFVNEQIKLQDYYMNSENIHESIKIVLISDLHDHVFKENNQEIIDTISEQNPDLIMMLGDFINDDSQDEGVLLHLVNELSKISTTYFALGNHEIEYMNRTGSDIITKIEDLGVHVLDLEYEDIIVNGNHIRIGGMYDYAFALDGYDSCNPETMKPEVYQFLTEFQDTDDFKLMLAHRPDSFVLGEASVTWDIDLVVSGHTHGGQFVLPVLGGLWATEQGWFPEYVHGYYEKDNLKIYITSGLSSNKKLLPRFNNPAEIAVITLLGE
ncbi:MAG: metallophosphoesterase [Erysipelotrichaceae bacterium]|nr:metallophosphoesterase [Erysipelotrichaceae bacterium]